MRGAKRQINIVTYSNFSYSAPTAIHGPKQDTHLIPCHNKLMHIIKTQSTLLLVHFLTPMCTTRSVILLYTL